MKFLRDTTWEAVFQGWKAREANNLGWIRCATEIKGWPDWESWRRFTAGLIHAEKRDWKIFRFTDPLEEIPRLLVGPYTGWQSGSENKNVMTFSELFDIPSEDERFRAHTGVQAIRRHLPFSTDMIGLIRDDNQKIVLLDGHHRAAAVTLAKRDGEAIDFSHTVVTIALAHFSVDEVSLLDEVLKRGSSKDQTW